MKTEKQAAFQNRWLLAFVSAAVFFTVIWAMLLLEPVHAAAGCRSKAMEKRPIIVIGDPLAALCLRLNIAPMAWVGRKSLWEKGTVLSAASEFLGCYGRLSGPKGPDIISRIKQLTPSAVYVTHLDCRFRPDISHKKIRAALESAGIQPVMIDFSSDLEAGVKAFSAQLDREAEGEALISAYEKGMKRARKLMAGVPTGLRVAVMAGTFQAGTGKAFTRVEAPGGYSDALVLKPLGAVNVAADGQEADERPQKGHVSVRCLERVLKTWPEVIAATGDPLAVSIALGAALARQPDLAAVPAVANSAIYPLPLYVEADPLDYPDVIIRWASALAQGRRSKP